MKGVAPRPEAEVMPLLEGAAALGLAVSKEQAAGLLRYLDELLAEAVDLNLTAIHDRADALEKHLLDSISVLRCFDPPGGAPAVVDVGSGGGLPGVPLKIMRPGWRVVLVDAAHRRVTATAAAAVRAGVAGMETLHARAEELGRRPGYREAFDMCVARAVAPLPVLVECGLPLVRLDGVLIAMKGPNVDAELAAGARAVEILGGVVEEVDRFLLPFSGSHRSLVRIVKRRRTPAAYPRRSGIPRKRPL